MSDLHKYSVSGLGNVFLKNGYRRHDTPYGGGVSYMDEDGLLRAIAIARALHGGGMSASEVKFLRGELDLTQAELGARLRKSGQTIAKWEKEECEVPFPSAALIRLLVLQKFLPNASVCEVSTDVHAQAEYVMTFEHGEWTHEAVPMECGPDAEIPSYAIFMDRPRFATAISMHLKSHLVDQKLLDDLRFYGNDEKFGDECDEAQPAVA